MSCRCLRFCIAVVMLTVPFTVRGGEAPVTAGFLVRAGNGQPLAGAKVFLYESRNVRRPADFISSATAADGRAVIALPPGRYWAVARLKRDGSYGPLMPGDRHSGEPMEIEISPSGPETEFMVTDLREAGQNRRTEQTETRVVSGRVTTAAGAPVAGVWVYGHRTQQVDAMPDYVSAWTDRDGRYRLHVAASDRVFIGTAREFPPSGRLVPVSVAPRDAASVDIVLDRE